MKNFNEENIIGYLYNIEHNIELPLHEGINDIKSEIFKENPKFKFLQNLQFILFKLNIQSNNRAYLRSYEQFPLNLKFKKNNKIDEYFICKSGIVTISSLYDLQIKVLNSKISFGKFYFEKYKKEKISKENNSGRALNINLNNSNNKEVEIIDLLTQISHSDNTSSITQKKLTNASDVDENKSEINNRRSNNSPCDDSVDSGENVEIVYSTGNLEEKEKSSINKEDISEIKYRDPNFENRFIDLNVKDHDDYDEDKANECGSGNEEESEILVRSLDKESPLNLEYNNPDNLHERHTSPFYNSIGPYAVNNYDIIVIPKIMLSNFNFKQLYNSSKSGHSMNLEDKIRDKNFKVKELKLKIDKETETGNIKINDVNPVKSSDTLRKNEKQIENIVLPYNRMANNSEKDEITPNQEPIGVKSFLGKRPREKTQENFPSKKLKMVLHDDSSTTNSCMICLDKINNPSKVNTCGHIFCKECIDQWTEVSNSCPLCKKEFKKIIYYTEDNKIIKERKVRKKQFKYEDEEENDAWIDQCLDHCMKCKETHDVYLMLVCDKCHYNVCHTYCAGLDKIPEEDWLCFDCDKEKVEKVKKVEKVEKVEKEKKVEKVEKMINIQKRSHISQISQKSQIQTRRESKNKKEKQGKNLKM